MNCIIDVMGKPPRVGDFRQAVRKARRIYILQAAGKLATWPSPPAIQALLPLRLGQAQIPEKNSHCGRSSSERNG